MGGSALEISGKTGADARLLGGRVDGDKDKIGFLDSGVDIGGEEEVAAARLTDNVDEARFVYGEAEIGRVPGVDTGLVEIDNGDVDVRALEGDDRAGWATDVASAD